MTSMNHMDPSSGDLAIVEYLDGEYRIIRPGHYVLCAVTGAQIALADLRYWNVDLQEAYASPQAALQRYQELSKAQGGG